MNFSEKFNEIAHIIGLSEARMVCLLPTHLGDVAQAIFNSFDDATKTNWSEATTRLKAHFSSEHFLDLAKEQIKDMKIFSEEAPVMFSDRVRKKYSRSLPRSR